jgi:hypothetical protein
MPGEVLSRSWKVKLKVMTGSMGLSDYVGKSSKIQWIVIIFPFEIVI